ncbi:SusC/RagA family TonB-linked outer membrane protein [Terrimonas pollutisoli]|uniref:SusC/RagA family TonB-linked outer membrane protein n=1 Tax=Terrimonas pollutisoli TaxID=3034147 RepID=UPI0023EC92E3|nr:TonB-dependent receptor [Terrimonas sp. H1YJ31]
MSRLAMRCIYASLLLLFLSSSAIGQQRSIIGVVTGENNSPLKDVSVVLKGSGKGTATDEQGQYSIVVDTDNVILVFSFTGYNASEIEVGPGRTRADVSLTQLSKTLQDVVVVGYGNLKKKMLTTAVASVSSKQVRDLPVLSPGAALAGQVSGVSVQSTNGSPGQAPVIRVRGTGSINAGNSPLYVVDGYPLPDNAVFNLINPQDIESMEVLKDAASCAIYGSRGGNGVVMVTTKKGSSGKTKFAFNAYAGTQQALKKVSVLNTPQLIEYMKEVYTNKGQAVPASFVNPPADLPNTDWQDVILRNALQHSYQLSASGGSDAVKYAVSGGYLSQDGIVKGTGYQRYNLRANLDAQLTKRIKLGVSLMPSFIVNTNKDTRGDGAEGTSGGTGALGGFYGILANAAMMPPLFPVKYANGNYAQPAIDPLNFGLSPNFTNPMAIIDLYEDKTKTTVFLGNTYLEAKIMEGLKFKTTFGFMNSNSSRNVFTPSTYGGSGSTTASFTNPSLSAIRAQRQVGMNYNWLSENYLAYDKTMGDHDISAVAGYSAQQNVSTMETVNSVTGSFLTDAVHTVAGAGQTTVISSYTGNNLTSMYARVNYAYQDKYILGAAFRRDGSSRFGTNNKYANFPSVSAAWRIKEEKFMDKFSFLSDLKLRASHGFTGNYNIGDYAWQSYMGSANYSFGTGNGTVNYGYIPGGLSNANLTWEKNQQTDLGLEAGFFKDRLAVTVDLYRRITSSLLLNKNIPAINGFALTILENVGKVQNQGLEIGIASKNLTGRLTWNTNFNITFNRNKVLELVNHVPLFQGFLNGYKIEEGKPIGQFWGYKQIGVYRSQKDVDDSPKWAANTMKPGDVKYEDYNHDGKVDVKDMQAIGNAAPKFTFGLVNSFQYANFDLNIIMRGSYGAKNLYGIDRNQFRFSGSVNPRTNVLDRWKSEQNPGNGMEPRAGGPAQDAMSDRYLHDASFLHIANVTLGYTVPKKTSSYFDGLRFYVSSQNLAMFTKKYPGYNPESNVNNDATLGFDNGSSYPLYRSFILGVNLNF